jgi:hypothetical protein
MLDMELIPELDVIADEVSIFAAKLQGELILPGDADYDEARGVWNGMIDRYPQVVAQHPEERRVAGGVGFEVTTVHIELHQPYPSAVTEPHYCSRPRRAH